MLNQPEITIGVPEHPGKILERTLESAGITQKDFALMIGRPVKTINQIIQGKKAITAQTACDIELFEKSTNALWWLQKQAAYDLAVERQTYSNTLRTLPEKEKIEPLSKCNSMKDEILKLQSEGKKYWEIGWAVGIPPNTVYKALKRWEKENGA